MLLSQSARSGDKPAPELQAAATARRAAAPSRPHGRRLCATAQAVAEATRRVELTTEPGTGGQQKVVFRKGGWDQWMNRDQYKTNYIAAGDSGPIIVLIHGFGASAYHYRYNIPELARSHRVFSPCLLGFGWSDKPLVKYSDYRVWIQQIQDFIQEVVRPAGERVVLVGNSLGGYVALATAASDPSLVSGVVLLNAAGRFQDVKEVVVKEVETAVASENGGAPLAGAAREAKEATTPPDSSSSASPSGRKGSSSSGGMNSAYRTALAAANKDEEASLLDRLTAPFRTIAQRAAVYLAFLAAKQPSRIRQVLEQVYYDKGNLDEDLVDSISAPARDPNAAEVFFRIITGRGEPVNVLLDRIAGTPLLLLWGRHDPWIRPETAERITKLYPAAETRFVEGGHCPQDDAPAAVNAALADWIRGLPSTKL